MIFMPTLCELQCTRTVHQRQRHHTQFFEWANKNTGLMFFWPCITVHQYSETNVMHFSFNLLSIKGLYMFRALLAHPQEALQKRYLVQCVRVKSVGSSTPTLVAQFLVIHTRVYCFSINLKYFMFLSSNCTLSAQGSRKSQEGKKSRNKGYLECKIR
jgi:hypothetical protein